MTAARQRLPRPRYSHRHSPGQLGLWNRPTVIVLLPHGRSLSLLQGGRAAPAPEPTPIAASARRAA